MKITRRVTLLLLVIMVCMLDTTSATTLDNIVVFLSDPSVNNIALILGSDPWSFLSPYLGGYIMMIAYIQYEGGLKDSLAPLGLDEKYVYKMAMDEVYSLYM